VYCLCFVWWGEREGGGGGCRFRCDHVGVTSDQAVWHHAFRCLVAGLPLWRPVFSTSICGFWDVLRGNATGFASDISVFPCQYHPPCPPCSLINLLLSVYNLSLITSLNNIHKQGFFKFKKNCLHLVYCRSTKINNNNNNKLLLLLFYKYTAFK
jgi:hypothetical protein